jgi:hypothetical protein
MIRVHHLNNTWIIVTGARESVSGTSSFDRCWTGSGWTTRPSSAKKYATRIEAEAEIERSNEQMRSVS